jgi:ABC-type phosphate transport system auxiliary subunit
MAQAAPPGAEPTVQELQQRMAHLEEQLRGLQDSVHRETVRQTGRISELEARMEPAALAVALNKDARERGL